METFYDVTQTPFPDVHVREATVEHTRTAILLHERGSSGPEFADYIFSLKLDDSGTNLASTLPEWRWVFPSGRYLWTPAFMRQIRSWFESTVLLDATSRKRLDSGGFKESVEYLVQLIGQEIIRLGGIAENLIILGHGQGAAVGIWALLCWKPDVYSHPIRGFVGMNCWLPYTKEVQAFLVVDWEPVPGGIVAARQGDGNYKFVRKMMNSTKDFINSYDTGDLQCPLLFTPIFLGHCVDNPYVSIVMGIQARGVLSRVGFKSIYWDELNETGEEGHWFKDRDQLRRVVDFFEQRGDYGNNIY